MVKSKKNTGLIMACTAALAWSTFGTFSTLLSGYGLSEGTISLISPLFLLVGFTIVAIISSGIGSMKIPRKALVFLFLDGGCSALYNYACVQAYANLPIGIVSTVIYCNLFALIFICRIVFKDPITRQKLLAVGMALIGVMMVVNVFGAGSEGSITAKGLIWAFLAMLAWAGLMTNENWSWTEAAIPMPYALTRDYSQSSSSASQAPLWRWRTISAMFLSAVAAWYFCRFSASVSSAQ